MSLSRIRFQLLRPKPRRWQGLCLETVFKVCLGRPKAPTYGTIPRTFSCITMSRPPLHRWLSHTIDDTVKSRLEAIGNVVMPGSIPKHWHGRRPAQKRVLDETCRAGKAQICHLLRIRSEGHHSRCAICVRHRLATAPPPPASSG